MATSKMPGLPGGSIIVDEIGIETGLYGTYRLKSVYQTVFAVSERLLTPVGVESFVQPQRDLQPVEPEAFLARVAVEDQVLVKSLCRALHIGNHHHIGVKDLCLHLNCETGMRGDRDEAVAQIDLMAQWAEEAGLAAGLVVCGFAAREVHDQDVPRRLVDAVRAHGFLLAVDDFGPGHSVLDRIQRMKPDVVKIDGGWFRRIAGIEAATRLLAKLVGALQRDGARVLIKGIETADQLNVALAVGADLVQGFLLARPALAGVVVNTAPLAVERFFRDPDMVVVRLRERGNGSE